VDSLPAAKFTATRRIRRMARTSSSATCNPMTLVWLTMYFYMYFFHVSCIHTYVIVKTDCTIVVSFITMYDMSCLLRHKASSQFFFCTFRSFIGLGGRKSCSLTL
jgi:hypothetical protein